MTLYDLISYDVLRVIWWGLSGRAADRLRADRRVSTWGWAPLLPFVAKTDTERRMAINTVGPVWEGNQVWFILGGGAIFAAWAAALRRSASWASTSRCSLVLAAFIVRPVAFKYRSKRDSAAWRSTWDWGAVCGRRRCLR